MHEWPDDDLDDLFRKSAEEADPVKNPEDWQHLNARLSENGQPRWTTNLVRWGIPSLLFLLVSTGGIIWYRGFSAVNTNKIARASTPAGTVSLPPARNGEKSLRQVANRSATAPPARTTRPMKPEPMDATDGLTQSVTTQNHRTTRTRPTDVSKIDRVATGPKQNSRLITSRELTPANSMAINQPINQVAGQDRQGDLSPSYQRARPTKANRTTRMFIGNRAQTRLADRDSAVAGIKQEDRQSVVPVTSAIRQSPKADGVARLPIAVPDQTVGQRIRRHANPDASDNLADESIARSGFHPGPAEPATDSLRFTWPTPDYLLARQVNGSAAPVSFPAVRPLKTEVPGLSAPRPRLSKVSVQVVVSPDLSAIGFHNFDRPGTNVGVLGQYQLSKRFSLQTGALWSTKRYTTLASEYVWPTTAPTGALRPESVTGRCTMLDIPLNLRYDVLLRPGRAGQEPIRWFVSGGVTSYFIDHEAYTYNYANPNDPAIRRTSWDNKLEGKKGGSFGLSAINVSIGYERPISQRFSVQVEPFLKIPVRQIGYFNVHLLSTGAFLSLRYHL